MSNRWLLCAAMLVLAAGCSKKEPAQTSETPVTEEVAITSPVGFVWKWEGTQTPVERIVPPDPTHYTLEFLPDTSVVAQIDCNRGVGKYKMDGKSIAIGPLATTRMACPEGSLDGRFVQQLEAARVIFFRGDTLYMDLFADSGTMKFSQMAEPQSH
jgi:heat shock protein HslJ